MGFLGKPTPPSGPQMTAEQTTANTAAGNQTLTNNAMGRTSDFGSSQFSFDPTTGLPTGINTTSNPGLNAAGGVANVGGLISQLPGTTVDYSNTTPQAIANSNYAAYQAMTQPGQQLAQKNLNTQMSDRGIPIGSEVYNDAQGTLDRANAVANSNASAQFLNAVPQNAAIMTNTANVQQMEPYQQAAAGEGLLSGINSLTPQAQQPQAQYQPATPATNDMNAFNAANSQYNNIWNGAGALAKVAGSAATGGALGGLFNSPPPTGFPASGVAMAPNNVSPIWPTS